MKVYYAKDIVKSKCFNCVSSRLKRVSLGVWNVKCLKGIKGLQIEDCPLFKACDYEVEL